MIKDIQFKVTIYEAQQKNILIRKASRKLGVSGKEISGIKVLKKSIDARKTDVYFNYRVKVYLNEPIEKTTKYTLDYKDVSKAKEIHIIGFGPAGMFAALRCLELGFKPVIFETR